MVGYVICCKRIEISGLHLHHNGTNPNPWTSLPPYFGDLVKVLNSTSYLTVNSVDLSGKPITGMWTVLRYTNHTTITSGFTPVSFQVRSGTTYVVHVGNYQGYVFNHWNNGNTTSYYTLTPTQNVTLTAYYSTS